MERPISQEPLPPFLQQFADRGRLEGKAEGKLEGKAEGKAEGKLEGKRSALLRLLQRAGIALSESQQAQLEGCLDTDTLDRWLDNLLGAKTADEVLR